MEWQKARLELGSRLRCLPQLVKHLWLCCSCPWNEDVLWDWTMKSFSKSAWRMHTKLPIDDVCCHTGHCCVVLLSNFLDSSHGRRCQAILAPDINRIPRLRSWSRFLPLEQKIWVHEYNKLFQFGIICYSPPASLLLLHSETLALSPEPLALSPVPLKSHSAFSVLRSQISNPT